MTRTAVARRCRQLTAAAVVPVLVLSGAHFESGEGASINEAMCASMRRLAIGCQLVRCVGGWTGCPRLVCGRCSEFEAHEIKQDFAHRFSSLRLYSGIGFIVIIPQGAAKRQLSII